MNCWIKKQSEQSDELVYILSTEYNSSVGQLNCIPNYSVNIGQDLLPKIMIYFVEAHLFACFSFDLVLETVVSETFKYLKGAIDCCIFVLVSQLNTP